MKRKKKRTVYGYDVEDPFDRSMVLSLPYSQLNRTGRKMKRRYKVKTV